MLEQLLSKNNSLRVIHWKK